MNSLLIAVATVALYLVAYNTYGRFLARRIFKIDPEAKCPSEVHHDGIDFVATDKLVLFGHHFTSIAGTGPIVGPAIAIIWGWVPALGKKHPATFIAVFTALLLAFSSGSDGKGALSLWPLFGSVNQLLASMALLVITIWLARKNRPIVYTGIPLVFMVAMTSWAMRTNLVRFYDQGKWTLLIIGAIIVLLQLWMVVEGIIVLARLRRKA